MANGRYRLVCRFLCGGFCVPILPSYSTYPRRRNGTFTIFGYPYDTWLYAYFSHHHASGRKITRYLLDQIGFNFGLICLRTFFDLVVFCSAQYILAKCTRIEKDQVLKASVKGVFLCHEHFFVAYDHVECFSCCILEWRVFNIYI